MPAPKGGWAAPDEDDVISRYEVSMRAAPNESDAIASCEGFWMPFLPLPLDARTGVVRSPRWPRLTPFASSNVCGLGEERVDGGVGEPTMEEV